MLADGSEYRGDYDPGAAALADFHRPRIEALVEAGADLLAFETIPTVREAEVLVGLLDDVATPAWLSYSCRDGAIDVGRRADRGGRRRRRPSADRRGRRQLHRPAVSCPPSLPRRGRATDLPLIAYPNGGDRWDAGEPALGRRRRRWLRPRRWSRHGPSSAPPGSAAAAGPDRPTSPRSPSRSERPEHGNADAPVGASASLSEGEGQTASVGRREKIRIAGQDERLDERPADERDDRRDVEDRALVGRRRGPARTCR